MSIGFGAFEVVSSRQQTLIQLLQTSGTWGRQGCVPTVLWFVGNHEQDLRHGITNAFSATVRFRVRGTGVELSWRIPACILCGQGLSNTGSHDRRGLRRGIPRWIYIYIYILVD